MGFKIAIDGPAGAGKSTIARRTAGELGFVYVDTGAMYRALAYDCCRRGVSGDEEEKIAGIVSQAEVQIVYDAEHMQQVILNGTNVTNQLRREEVGAMASSISAYAVVRERLLGLQRQLAKMYDVIMDGRDIGTRVLPDAQLKIYLTASVDVRADRRCKELKLLGVYKDFDAVKADIEERDWKDMNRSIAPLRQAEDAVLIDSSALSISEVVCQITQLYRERMVRS